MRCFQIIVVNSSIVAAIGLAVDQSIIDIALYWMVQNIILSQNSDRSTRFNRKWITVCEEKCLGINRMTYGVKAQLDSFVSKCVYL
jgi:hypothetical protein